MIAKLELEIRIKNMLKQLEEKKIFCDTNIKIISSATLEKRLGAIRYITEDIIIEKNKKFRGFHFKTPVGCIYVETKADVINFLIDKKIEIENNIMYIKKCDEKALITFIELRAKYQDIITFLGL